MYVLKIKLAITIPDPTGKYMQTF